MMSAPIFHIGGTLGLLVSLHQGKQLVVLPRFDAGTWLAQVERHRVARPSWCRPCCVGSRPPGLRVDRSQLAPVPQLRAAAAPVDLVRRAMAALPGVDFSNTFGRRRLSGPTPP